MKHNIRNKPQLYKIPSDLTEHLNFETQIIEWFEGFEKELREDLNSFDWEHKKGNHETSTCLICQWLEGRIEMIQEILGEASSQEGSRGG